MRITSLLRKANPLRLAHCAALVVGVLAISACASGPASQTEHARLTENDGRVEFVENRISDHREEVLQRALASFGLQPDCSTLKSGLLDSRRAITVEDCVYDLQSEDLAYAGTPIEQVTYRFVDNRLFQMRFAFKRSSSAVERIGESVSGDLQLSRATSDNNSQRWQSKRDVVELMEDSEIGTAALQITDARLLDKVIAQR